MDAASRIIKDKRQIVWIAFAVIIAAVYLFGLTIPLVGPDEPRYTQIAREMFERGDYITPQLGGFDWFEKPVLLYWIQIVSFKLFGVSEFAARFGSALFGLGTILSLWILGKNVEPRAETRNPKSNVQNRTRFAHWLALVAASSLGLVAFSRGASFDIIVTFPITASLVGFFIFDQSDTTRPKTRLVSLIAFYFFIGVALLAKGLIGVVFPLAIVAFYYVLSAKLPDKTFIVSLFWGTLLWLLVAGSWYLPMYLANGWKFIDEFFIQHHFQRYASNKYKHPEPIWFLWVVLPLMTIPWLFFYLAGIWDFFRKSFSFKEAVNVTNDKSRAARTIFIVPFSKRDPILLFALSWLLVLLVFFSFSGSKLPGYVLPALPAACIFTAVFVDQFVKKAAWREWILQIMTLITFSVFAIILQFVMPQVASEDSVKGLMETARQKGYVDEIVLNLHNVSHNAEFYAAKRVVRGEDGNLRKFLGIPEITRTIAENGGRDVLVLVKPEFLLQLTESDLVEATVLDRNEELLIVAVKLK